MSWAKWIIAAGVAYVGWAAWRGITDAIERGSNPEGNRYG